MKHTRKPAAWMVVSLLLGAPLSGAVSGAMAQPVDPYAETAPVDPYGEPPKAPTKAEKAAAAKAEKAAAAKAAADKAAADKAAAKQAAADKAAAEKAAKAAAKAAKADGVVDPYADGGAKAVEEDPLMRRKPGGGGGTATVVPTGTGAGTGTGTGTGAPGAPAPALPGRFDLAAIQGLLAVQNLDGWLIVDLGGSNPVARSLVAVQGAVSRRWFYLVPRVGEPTLLCHASEVSSFAMVPGTRVTYTGYRDLDKNLRALLKGKKTLAMEYSPKGALPSLSRVDAGTIELVRGAGVAVKSSDGLVQFAKATWGLEGRKKHYVAAHHLVELRKDAIAYIAKQLAAGAVVTERDVQLRLEKGMATRGLIGPAPVVAFGKSSADPDYVPAPGRAATLAAGDVVMLSLAGKVEGGVFAAHSWVAIADSVVSAKVQVAFENAALARDEALALVSDRVKRHRAVKGWEVDKAARDFLTKAGLIDHVLHRTGHSLDGDLYGSGTDLDDLEVKDQRNLVVGTGFTIGPGLYYAGELGLRAEVSAYLGKDGLEITTPAQEWVETLVPKP